MHAPHCEVRIGPFTDWGLLIKKTASSPELCGAADAAADGGQGLLPSSRAMARQVAEVLPCLETIDFDGLGHMGPISHPERVNAAIEDFPRRPTFA